MSPLDSRGGWADPSTARLYEDFCERHPRYREANRVLAEKARVGLGHRVLDFAAGTGRTAEAILPGLGEGGRVLCVEASEAMRSLGRERLPDPRIRWTADLPRGPGAFDRVVCGAAVWQCLPLDRSLERLAGLLAPGGALCFNIPSAYLGQADDPGGGRDPYLVELPALLAGDSALPAADGVELPTPSGIEALLVDLELRPEAWSMRTRLTQEAYRDWLAIPAVGGRLLWEPSPEERVRRIDRAYRRVDPDSWRWESWSGWTAWRP